jgi:hypothetical protein
LCTDSDCELNDVVVLCRHSMHDLTRQVDGAEL